MANRALSEWANSGPELFLELGRGSGKRAGVEDALRGAIRSGRLPRGTQLPPTRTLARDLGVSRGTVLQAYAQLAAEGWIAGRRGSSTVVAFGGGKVAMEEPSMPLHRASVRAAGLELVLLPVDDAGARVEELARVRDVGAVVLTPHRQHPTGATLSARRRSWLLDWTRSSNVFV